MNQMTKVSAAIVLAGAMLTVGIARAEAANQPSITNGDSVIIKLTIQIPEDHMVIPERVSEYTHGRQELFPALEAALEGKRVGDQAHLDLDPDHAFGPYDPDKRLTVARNELPKDAKLGDVGNTPDGLAFTIVDLSEGSGIVDFNHPLAGKRVVLNVIVMDIKPRL